MKEVSSENCASFKFLFPVFRSSAEKRTLGFSSFLIASSTTSFFLEELRLYIGDIIVSPTIRTSGVKKKANKHFCRISFDVNLDDALRLSIHTLIEACVVRGKRIIAQEPIVYNLLLPKYMAAHGPYLSDENSGVVAFFRQAADKKMYLTVRHANVTDTKRAQIKLFLAFVLSLFAPFKRPTLVYEKNASKYEESGKAVYEELIDRGYKRIYFVIAKKALEDLQVSENYRENFIVQHTFRHYFNYFRCRTFIGTEAIPHVLELRVQNPFAQRRAKNFSNTFIFLQHGVMYMVSLDSPQRTSFRRQRMRGKVRVVVSSQTEANHFIQLADYDQEELIISGLPKFDCSYQNEGADKILIMPTWRIWEFNAMRSDPESTKYVAMIKRIVASIPQELQDKVVVAPHPLFSRDTFKHNENTEKMGLDELLRDVKLLITDYSSISFDAFYRGANVIFYWEELDECMKEYGEPTHLLLNEDNAFGDICYNTDSLSSVVSRNYNSSQTNTYIEKYRHIVTYHDGRNTRRLVEALEQEGILESK